MKRWWAYPASVRSAARTITSMQHFWIMLVLGTLSGAAVRQLQDGDIVTGIVYAAVTLLGLFVMVAPPALNWYSKRLLRKAYRDSPEPFTSIWEKPS